MIVALGGCAGLTPEQGRVYDQFNACRGEGPTVDLIDVHVTGEFTLTGRNSHLQLVKRCLMERFGYDRFDPRILERPTEPGGGG